MLNLRLARPQYIVDLNGIPGLDYITERDGALAIGALTRQRCLERSPRVRQDYPLLYEATTLIGHRAIRNRGTVGGSIAHADPAAELPAVLVAYGGSVQVQGPRGTRQIAATDFFRAYFTTALEPDEILTEVHFPRPPAGTGWCFMEESRRHGDFAMVGVAVLLTLDTARQCTHVAVVLCGVGSVPHQVAAAPALLLGHTVEAARLRDVAQAAAAEIEPESDLHASAEFRRHLSTVLIQRALRQAAMRATV
jgi:CO/xanthine dehydrogenase FAD-binding subunit